MAIARVGVASNEVATVVPLPAGLAALDTVLAFVLHDGTGPLVTPTDWDPVVGIEVDTDRWFDVIQLIAEGGEISGPALAAPSAIVFAVITAAYRGAGAGTPIEVTAVDEDPGVARGTWTSGDPTGSHVAGQVAVMGYATRNPAGFITLPDTFVGEEGMAWGRLALREKTTNTRNPSTVEIGAGYSAGGIIVVLRERYDEDPDAPALVSPANAAPIDLDADVDLIAAFSDVDAADYATGYQARLKDTTAGSYSYWNEATQALVGAPVTNVSTAEQATIPGGTLPNDASYQWSFAFRDRKNNLGPFATDRTFVGTDPAVVTVTAPTGTVVDTTRPPIEWGVVDPEGDPVTSWHAKVFTAAAVAAPGFDPETAGAAWDSGETAGSATTITPDEDLANAEDFYAYVKAETGGLWSAWDQGPPFDVDLTPPTTPTVVATTNDDEAAVELDVSAAVTDGYSGYRFVVRRLVDGTFHGYVRGATPTDPLADDESDPDTAHATVVDREAPLGLDLTYEAQVLADFEEP